LKDKFSVFKPNPELNFQPLVLKLAAHLKEKQAGGITLARL